MTSHHILGRAVSDEVDTIVALCQEHHDMAHRHEIPRNQLLGLVWNADFDRGNRNHRRIKREGGQGLVGMALILPFLLVLITGIS